MSLRSWCKKGWLRKLEPAQDYIFNLLKGAKRDLQACKVNPVGLDWKFQIAFSAILKAAKAALAAEGYRLSRFAQQYRAIGSLAFTLKLNKIVIRTLDCFRKKRHVCVYKQVDTISEWDLKTIQEYADRIVTAVEEFLKSNHPSLC